MYVDDLFKTARKEMVKFRGVSKTEINVISLDRSYSGPGTSCYQCDSFYIVSILTNHYEAANHCYSRLIEFVCLIWCQNSIKISEKCNNSRTRNDSVNK